MLHCAGAAEAAGSALTVPLDDSSAPGQLRQRVLIRLPCSGRVTLHARLNYQTAEVSYIVKLHTPSNFLLIETGALASTAYPLPESVFLEEEVILRSGMHRFYRAYLACVLEAVRDVVAATCYLQNQ